jgi:hypothetical protein
MMKIGGEGSGETFSHFAIMALYAPDSRQIDEGCIRQIEALSKLSKLSASASKYQIGITQRLTLKCDIMHMSSCSSK